MRQIKYRVGIKYTDFDGSSGSSSYDIFASTVEDATRVAKVLFFADIGALPQMSFTVDPVIPAEGELSFVQEVYYKVFMPLCRSFDGLSYKEFLRMFKVYCGYSFAEANGLTRFQLKFQGFECVAMFQDGKSWISEDEISFHSRDGGSYVIRGGIFIGT